MIEPSSFDRHTRSRFGRCRFGATPNARLPPVVFGLRACGIVFAPFVGDMAFGVPPVAGCGRLGVHLGHAQATPAG
jgi:hypothetical protein